MMSTLKSNGSTDYTYLGYRCLSGSVVCMGGIEDPQDPNNPDKIKWEQVENSRCSAVNERMPGAISIPNCNQSKGLSPLSKGGMNPTLKAGLWIGGAVVVTGTLIGLAIHFTKKTS